MALTPEGVAHPWPPSRAPEKAAAAGRADASLVCAAGCTMFEEWTESSRFEEDGINIYGQSGYGSQIATATTNTSTGGLLSPQPSTVQYDFDANAELLTVERPMFSVMSLQQSLSQGRGAVTCASAANDLVLVGVSLLGACLAGAVHIRRGTDVCTVVASPRLARAKVRCYGTATWKTSLRWSSRYPSSPAAPASLVEAAMGLEVHRNPLGCIS